MHQVRWVGPFALYGGPERLACPFAIAMKQKKPKTIMGAGGDSGVRWWGAG
jgi:hypothetical protein